MTQAMRERTEKDKKITKKDLDALIIAANSSIQRAKRDAVKVSRLMVSREFAESFYTRNKQVPLMICGMFYDIDDGLKGLSCYLVKEY